MKMIRHHTSVLLASALLSFTTGCASTVDKQARNMSASCAACHGTNGNSVGGAPALAGTDKAYFIEQMKNFKSGVRPATVMHQHAKGYNDVEIEHMAAYFAAQKPSTK